MYLSEPLVSYIMFLNKFIKIYIKMTTSKRFFLSRDFSRLRTRHSTRFPVSKVAGMSRLVLY